MGWLFGKKKVPQVPFPEGIPVDSKHLDMGALRLPKKAYKREQVIQPERIKEAAGFGKPLPSPPSFEDMPFPELEQQFKPSFPTLNKSRLPLKRPMPVPFFVGGAEPMYIKVDVYRKLLGELDDLKKNLSSLGETNHKLSNSEYNEEKNFEKLKRTVKSVHDRLLQIDKTIFKIQGE